jgi:hypothetical protein
MEPVDRLPQLADRAADEGCIALVGRTAGDLLKAAATKAPAIARLAVAKLAGLLRVAEPVDALEQRRTIAE